MGRKKQDSMFIQNVELVLAFSIGFGLASCMSGPIGYWWGGNEVRKEAAAAGHGFWGVDGGFEWLQIRPSESNDDDSLWRRR